MEQRKYGLTKEEFYYKNQHSPLIVEGNKCPHWRTKLSVTLNDLIEADGFSSLFDIFCKIVRDYHVGIIHSISSNFDRNGGRQTGDSISIDRESKVSQNTHIITLWINECRRCHINYGLLLDITRYSYTEEEIKRKYRQTVFITWEKMRDSLLLFEKIYFLYKT